MAKEKAVMGLIIYQKTPLIASAAYGYVASRICGFSHLKRLKLVLDSECIVRFLQLQRFLDEDWKCRHELQLDLPLPCGEKGKSCNTRGDGGCSAASSIQTGIIDATMAWECPQVSY